MNKSSAHSEVLQRLLLKQIEAHLVELQNLSYYSKDEYSRVDYAIHKGQYVLTSGPPKEVNLIDDSPILNYADKNATILETEIISLDSLDSIIESVIEINAPTENTNAIPTPSTQSFTPTTLDAQYDFGTEEKEPEPTIHSSIQPKVIEPKSPERSFGLSESRWRAPSLQETSGKPHEIASPTSPFEAGSMASQWSDPVGRVNSQDSWSLAGSANTKLAQSVRSPQATAPQVICEGIIGIARFDVDTGKQLHLRVQAGDKLKIGKHVSADTWNAVNFRTNAKGHIKSELVELPALEIQTKSLGSRFQPLDAVEKDNASQWDEGPQSAQIDSASQFNSASSDSLERKRDTEVSSQTSREISEEQLIRMTPRQVEYLVETKLAQLMAKRSVPSGGPSSRSWDSPRHAPESRNTHARTFTVRDEHGRQPCWWYVTPNQECRFTADECKDLHVDLEAFVAKYDPNLAGGKIQLTCYYWATPGRSCNFESDECKYAHYWTPTQQVAPKPSSTFKGKRDRYSRTADSDDWRTQNGTSHSTANAWGTPSESTETDGTVSDVHGWMAGTPGVSMPWGKPQTRKVVEEEKVVEEKEENQEEIDEQGWTGASDTGDIVDW